MTRESSKIITRRDVVGGVSIQSDFDQPQALGTIRDKGIKVIYSKGYLCACKSKESDHLNNCQNCGGCGIFWANPTETEMIISGISTQKANMNDFGLEDLGMVRVTATDDFKFSRMDSVEIKDATSELSQVLYLSLTDDETGVFCFTKYNIVSIDYVGLFVDVDQKIQRLIEGSDYTFHDNVILLDPKYLDQRDIGITVRYVYHPLFYILGIARESFTSPQGMLSEGEPKLILPIHAIAQRAHLVKDVENYDGDRLLDNSWEPSPCLTPDISKFNRQLKYTDVDAIYTNLTSAQKIAINNLILGMQS